jgi:hypothetical protein
MLSSGSERRHYLACNEKRRLNVQAPFLLPPTWLHWSLLLIDTSYGQIIRDWRNDLLRIGLRAYFTPEMHRRRRDVRPISPNERRPMI